MSLAEGSKSGRKSTGGRVTFPDNVKDENDVDFERNNTLMSEMSIADNSVTNKDVIPFDADELHFKTANPFKIPQDNDIFTLRDKQRERAKKERCKINQMSLWEKTKAAQGNNYMRIARLAAETSAANDEAELGGVQSTLGHTGEVATVHEDPNFTLQVTRNRHIEKESLTEYVNKKREMFLVQYALDVKRDEMRKLERVAQQEEQRLAQAEQFLEDDAAMFDEFLKENDKNSVEAVRVAEQETKSKLEKVSKIKQVNAQIMTLGSEINKFNDQLEEFKKYKKFLISVAPKEWQEKRAQMRKDKREKKRSEAYTAAQLAIAASGTDAKKKKEDDDDDDASHSTLTTSGSIIRRNNNLTPTPEKSGLSFSKICMPEPSPVILGSR